MIKPIYNSSSSIFDCMLQAYDTYKKRLAAIARQLIIIFQGIEQAYDIEMQEAKNHLQEKEKSCEEDFKACVSTASDGPNTGITVPAKKRYQSVPRTVNGTDMDEDDGIPPTQTVADCRRTLSECLNEAANQFLQEKDVADSNKKRREQAAMEQYKKLNDEAAKQYQQQINNCSTTPNPKSSLNDGPPLSPPLSNTEQQRL